MTMIPINAAEAIIEPFWDRQLSGIKYWNIYPETKVINGADNKNMSWWAQQSSTTYVYGDGYVVEPETDYGLKVYQTWCNLGFEWTSKPKKGYALKMSRVFDIDCKGYDKLIVSLVAPKKSIFMLNVITDKGKISNQYVADCSNKKEYFLNLNGAQHLYEIIMKIYAQDDNISYGWFNWIGLQNSQLLSHYINQWNCFNSDWKPYIKPESYEPDFKPHYGLFINGDELKQLRIEHNKFLKKNKKTPFTVKIKAIEKFVPEKMINEYVNFSSDTRFPRERDYNKILLGKGPKAAIAGLLLKDKKLLRLAARYAMSIAMCRHWDDGMMCCLSGSNFEHKAFVQSLCTYEIALILDLSWNMFTEIGRQFLFRRIAEEGIANINWRIWKHAEKPEEIFKMNQLAWFTPGRMVGYLMLEKSWTLVKPYTDIAYQDLINSINQCILPDGGYVEGPLYFGVIGRNAGLSLYYYARARGMDFKSIVPERIKLTSKFAEVLISTDENLDAIPICDCAQHLLDQEYLAIMATLLPNSQWVTMFNKSIARSGGVSDEAIACLLTKEIPQIEPKMKNFEFLCDMGFMSSLRDIDGQYVKLLILGNKAGAGHTHEDKGSFVLEFAGETFAMDPGSCDYSSPISRALKNCERHNMLVPYGTTKRPHPFCPLPFDVKPEGTGDNIRFYAKINAGLGWKGYYKTWVREWDSPKPNILIIRDEYELESGDGVEFYWNTKQDICVKENKISLTGKKGKLEVYVPKECGIRVDHLPLLNEEFQRRIAIYKKGKSGILEIKVKLSVI